MYEGRFCDLDIVIEDRVNRRLFINYYTSDVKWYKNNAIFNQMIFCAKTDMYGILPHLFTYYDILYRRSKFAVDFCFCCSLGYNPYSDRRLLDGYYNKVR